MKNGGRMWQPVVLHQTANVIRFLFFVPLVPRVALRDS